MRLVNTYQHYRLADGVEDYQVNKPLYKGYHHTYILWFPRYMLTFSYMPSIH